MWIDVEYYPLECLKGGLLVVSFHVVSFSSVDLLCEFDSEMFLPICLFLGFFHKFCVVDGVHPEFVQYI